MSIENRSWRKSSYSGGGDNSCVEVAPLATATGVRDSKDRTRGHIEIPENSWATMTAELKRP
ncbi:DUF397 domain-containing protein [Yinghuangia sp. ASG 101]|uniref:DUF397 domain-containing protein n=1 Tax=Yinghuangia sp. ASG 101 TaxID=2896848 RepID=UPI001E2BBD6C|nr:DUF397 domain-containing protein [Yinghuangia sp. ASG 101]UGQ15221.1 DUF397 domain-containing protein [Yinghuangia sp. ASG 101]